MEQNPKRNLAILSALSVCCFGLGGLNAGFGAAYFTGLAAVSAHYSWQLKKLNIEDRQTCWDLFVSNRWLGLILLMSIIGGKYELEKN